jgi:hypothetical protein
VPSVLATVVAQLAGAGDVVEARGESAGEPEDAPLVERDGPDVLRVAAADPQPASSPMVRSRNRSRPRRRLLSRMKEALPGDVTPHRLGPCGRVRPSYDFFLLRFSADGE